MQGEPVDEAGRCPSGVEPAQLGVELAPPGAGGCRRRSRASRASQLTTRKRRCSGLGVQRRFFVGAARKTGSVDMPMTGGQPARVLRRVTSR